MTDKRLLCVLVAVSLIAASAARPNDAQDNEGLRDLLGAMKRYLKARGKTSSRANAHDDERTVYDPCKTSLHR